MMNNSRSRPEVAPMTSLVNSAAVQRRSSSLAVEDVEDPPQGDKTKNIVVEDTALVPVRHSVGQAIQLSNDVVYYEEQLKIIASEIAEVKELDKRLNYKKTNVAKELLVTIKEHRSVIQSYINRVLKAANNNIILNRLQLFDDFVNDTTDVSNRKLELFSILRSEYRKTRNIKQ